MEKVMIKRVGENPEIVEVEKITLEYMQKQVKGFIEIPYLSDALNARRIYIVINEEGKLEGMEPNMLLLGDGFDVIDVIVGDILFVAHDGEGGTIGLSDEQIKDLNDIFKHNQVLTNMGAFNYIRQGDELLWT